MAVHPHCTSESGEIEKTPIAGAPPSNIDLIGQSSGGAQASGVVKTLQASPLCIRAEKHGPEGSRQICVLELPPAAPVGHLGGLPQRWPSDRLLKLGCARKAPEMLVTDRFLGPPSKEAACEARGPGH